MPKHYLTGTQIQNKTDEEIATLWNKLASIFQGRNNIETNQEAVVGFLQLSRETERRGLEMIETKFGRIILQPKKQLA